MSDARVVELLDAVGSYIRAGWPDGSTLDVVTDPDPDLDLDDPAALPRRTVFIFPEGYGQVEMVDRASDVDEYRLSVVVAERYAGEQPKPPRAWVRERVGWVERYVRRRLADNRAQAGPDGEIIPGSGIWPETVGVELVYDLNHLAERKLFFAIVTVAFREIVGA